MGELEVGRRYRITHSRHGTFECVVKEVGEEWVCVVLEERVEMIVLRGSIVEAVEVKGD